MESKLTYEQYLLQFDEIITRAKAIKARLDKMEFPLSQAVENDTTTAVAAFYAALYKMVEQGVPLSLVVQVCGFFYQMAEGVLVERLLEALRNEVLLRGPSKGAVN